MEEKPTGISYNDDIRINNLDQANGSGLIIATTGQ